MPSSPAPLRLGIVGAGGIVRSRHLPGWRQIPNLEIRAVCNSSLQSAQSFCDAHAPQAKALARWEEVVDNDEVDVVWIELILYSWNAKIIIANSGVLQTNIANFNAKRRWFRSGIGTGKIIRNKGKIHPPHALFPTYPNLAFF